MGSMSNHLLKFALLAKFLHHPMNDGKFLKPGRGHITPFFQRWWFVGTIKTIHDPISSFKQSKSIGHQDNIKVGSLERPYRPHGNSQHYQNPRSQPIRQDRRPNWTILVHHVQANRYPTLNGPRPYEKQTFDRRLQNGRSPIRNSRDRTEATFLNIPCVKLKAINVAHSWKKSCVYSEYTKRKDTINIKNLTLHDERRAERSKLFLSKLNSFCIWSKKVHLLFTRCQNIHTTLNRAR
jgi:hypothetical protein